VEPQGFLSEPQGLQKFNCQVVTPNELQDDIALWVSQKGLPDQSLTAILHEYRPELRPPFLWTSEQKISGLLGMGQSLPKS
jgi:hypothetical protein